MTKGLWLAEKAEESYENQSVEICFRYKIFKNGQGLQQLMIWFCMQNNKRTVKKYSKNPNKVKKHVFLAKCIENVALREKSCQQNRGQRDREIKLAT